MLLLVGKKKNPGHWDIFEVLVGAQWRMCRIELIHNYEDNSYSYMRYIDIICRNEMLI